MNEFSPITDFEVRVLAVLGADEITIPFEIINMPEYRTRAQSRAFSKLGNSSTIEIFDSLVIFEAARLLIPYYKMQIMKSEQSPHGKIERFDINWTYLEASLISSADEICCLALGNISNAGSWFFVTNSEVL